MLKKLKRKFAALSSALTALVLLAACIFAFNLAQNQAQNTYSESFDYQSQILSVMLANGTYLKLENIYALESESDIVAFLFDNGKAMNINGSKAAEESTELYNAAIAALQAAGAQADALQGMQAEASLLAPTQNYARPLSVNAKFSFQKEEYLAKFMHIPTGARSWYSAVLLKPCTQLVAEINRLLIFWALIFCAGLAALVLVSIFLARRSVAPVEKAQQKQKEFIAAASHELKSPLAVIGSCIDIAAEDQSQTHKQLANAKSEVRRMSGLVDDLLLLTGIEAGGFSVKKSKINLEDLLAYVYECFLPLAKEKEQKLTLLLPSEILPEIYADEERLTQVMAILLSNAISYCPNNCPIEISAKKAKRHVSIFVIDHGGGINAADKDKLFESFFRSEKSHSNKNHFGLGLPVAKLLVQLNGGTLSHSNTPQGGATFSIVLPC